MGDGAHRSGGPVFSESSALSAFSANSELSPSNKFVCVASGRENWEKEKSPFPSTKASQDSLEENLGCLPTTCNVYVHAEFQEAGVREGVGWQSVGFRTSSLCGLVTW